MEEREAGNEKRKIMKCKSCMRHIYKSLAPFFHRVSTDALMTRDLLEHEVINATRNQVPSSL